MTTYMTLGGYTFAKNPEKMEIPTKIRSAAAVETWTGVAFFSWGMFTAGRRLPIEFKYMSTAQFSAVESLFEADAAVAFDPGTGRTYTVEIMNFTGDYFEDQTTGARYRKNVTIDLLLLEDTTA